MNYKTFSFSIFLILASFFNGFSQVNQLEKAAQIAKEENKLIFINFSGSDWCRSCMVLKQSIIDTEEFASFANNNLIMLDIDFPKKKKNRLSKDQTQYNEKLAEKYNKEGQFPTIIILDSDLNIIAKTGYKRLSPTQYINHIKTLIKK
ncbi:thioredoxin family protein [Ancylomarina sp.]|uniref:thioredoxin family protein n=1 Tax=Ancylomarina sp. TaxID=1970196 RepID=UPI0035674F26